MIGMDRDTLLSRLDLTYSDLASVRKSLEAGDRDTALQNLVEHFRHREKPVYLFSEPDAAEFKDPLIVGEADRICNHEILGYRFGEQIDWHFNATAETSRDSEWTWSLVRHNFWVPLARAYLMTGDEKYALEFVSQLKGFTAACPAAPHMDKLEANMGFPGDAWRSIEAAIRIYTSWLPVMACLRKSPSWDEEGWLCFLGSLYDHGEFLVTHFSNHTRCSNWLTMECSALFQLGILFPEFKRAAEWKRLGYRRMCHEVRYQFDHDGVHIERTPVYHLVAVLAFLQAYRIAVLNDIPVPPYMLPILEKGAEFLMRLVKPDFTLPMFGDADRISLVNRKADDSPYEGMNLTTDPADLNEIRAFFSTMAELTGREDFLYFATGRRQGRPPGQTCFSMPHPGFTIFRTGWKEQDSYFAVTGTQVERGSNSAHSHSDAGHLELHIEGEDVLIDTGRYLYGNCSWLDWWQYFSSTRAHNTVEVDCRRMGDVPDTSPEVRAVRTFCHRFKSTPDLDMVEISHNGYAFLSDPVFHRRRVFFFKPSLWLVDDVLTGLGSHEYRLCFNLAPGRIEAVRDEETAFIYLGKKARIQCVSLIKAGLSTEVFEGQTEPKGGWVSYAYSKKVPTPQLVYTQTGRLPVRFISAIYQEGKAAVNVASSGKIDEVELNLSSNDRRWDAVLGLEKFNVHRVT